MSDRFLKQCFLQKATNAGCSYTTSWVDERLARTGKLIYFKDDPVKEIWQVISVNEPRQSEEYLKTLKDQYRHHRETADV